jgi:Protein of unknown function (DUF2799)
MQRAAMLKVGLCVTTSLLMAVLSGCATMSVEECKVAKWGEVGLRDGLAGEPLSKLNSLSKDCADAKVAVDTPAYLQGRDQGLVTYCRLDNATRLGLAGKSYYGACPAPVDTEFRRRFDLGREVYDAREQVRSQDNRRQDLERRLRDAKNDDERKRIRDDLSNLDYSQRRARDRARDAEWALDRLR